MVKRKGHLKHFVRYDANGRIISGSNILARKAPRVGRWTEKQAYECCNTTTTSTTSTPT